MTKYEFLNIIANGLNDFPQQELQDILYDYEEHFRNAYADGKTDDEILNELGDPYKIVNQYRSQYIQKYADTPKDNNSNSNQSTGNNNISNESTSNKVVKVILLVLLAIVLGPTLIGAFFTIFGLAIGIIGAAFGVTVACLATLAGKIGIAFLGVSAPAIAEFPTLVIILLSIGSIAGTILVIILFIYLIKGIIVLVKKLIDYFRNRGGI